MKKNTLPAMLAAGCTLLGVLCMAVRQWLLTAGTDKKGLLVAGHPGIAISWGFVGLVILILLAAILRSKLRCYFQESPLTTIGNVAQAVALGLMVGQLLPAGGALAVLAGIAALLAALCCAANAVCSVSACKYPPLFRCSLVIFYLLFIVFCYQSWSGEPQLQLYGFQLLALVCLTLTAYHRAALGMGLGSSRMYLFTANASVFFCLAAIPGTAYPTFFLLMAAATLLDGCFVKATQEDIMHLPNYVNHCIDRLETKGFAAYAVGGCVRDALLGLTPHDYDLCTDATPAQLRQVFADHQLVLAGEKHGTVTVIVDSMPVEITTFRTEGGYQDHRHPDWVRFESTIEADLSRRDFTINAMAYSPTRGLADPFGGRADLKSSCLRAVGEADRRFTEDALRILRGVRFAVRFDLTPEDSTLRAMEQLAPLMDDLARERVFSELCKLIPLIRAEQLQQYAPVITQVIPELKPLLGFEQHSPHHAYDIYTHTAHVVENVSKNQALRWAALLHDVGKPASFYRDENGRGHFPGHAALSAQIADQVLLRLKAPTALRQQVTELIALHMTPLEPDKRFLRRRLGKLGQKMLELLLQLQEADMCGKGTGIPEEVSQFPAIRQVLAEVLAEEACLGLSDLAVNGNDLMALGLQGKQIGACLSFLLQQVQDELLKNEKSVLLAAAKGYLATGGTDH